MHSLRPVALLALLLSVPAAFSQTSPRALYHSRLNTFGFFGEYSSTSSRILLGLARNRKLLGFGAFYRRRVLLNRFGSGQYLAELRPILLESDPLTQETLNFTSPPPSLTLTSDSAQAEACHPFSQTYTGESNGAPFSATLTVTCDRRQWTFGEGFSPFGFQWNFLPRHRLQPVVTALAGYMFSTKPIPVANAGSANFTFQIGAGLEFYRSATRSIGLEYRIHHLSNANSAQENPGVDNQLLQITYAFGR